MMAAKKKSNKKVNKESKSEDQEMSKKNEIDTKKEDKTLESDKSLFIGIAILVVLFLGIIYVVNIVISDDVQTPLTPVGDIVVYNGYEFERTEGVWKTHMVITDNFKGWTRPYDFLFHYNPYEVEDVPTVRNSINQSIAYFFIFREGTYITFDPDQEGIVLARIAQASVELTKIVSQVYEKPVKGGTTKYFSDSYPVITCEDASDKMGVIYIRLGNETKVYNDGLCLIVQGKNETDIIRAAEKVSFELLKIM